ncbi:hypothetical protein VTJ83DRAFT_1980 [Remersonia thermophila]|uniref:Uncharacterized protein n=1 Tax=Remersonia thermophila TaxID=72144 RepID=A0ABR4DIY6_9PEZI
MRRLEGHEIRLYSDFQRFLLHAGTTFGLEALRKRPRPVLPSVQAVEVRFEKAKDSPYVFLMAQFVDACFPGVTDLVLDCSPSTAMAFLGALQPRTVSSLRRLVLSCATNGFVIDQSHMTSHDAHCWRSLSELSVRNFQYFELVMPTENPGLTRLHLSRTAVPVLELVEALTHRPTTGDSNDGISNNNNSSSSSSSSNLLVSLVLDCVVLRTSKNPNVGAVTKTWAQVFDAVRVGCPNLQELEVSCYKYARDYPWGDDPWDQRHPADVASLQTLLETVRGRPGGEARAQVYEEDGETVRVLD